MLYVTRDTSRRSRSTMRSCRPQRSTEPSHRHATFACVCPGGEPWWGLNAPGFWDHWPRPLPVTSVDCARECAMEICDERQYCSLQSKSRETNSKLSYQMKSTFLILRFIENREPVNAVITNKQKTKQDPIDKFELFNEDWDLIEKLVKIFHPLQIATTFFFLLTSMLQCW